ncbi:hypothetical protein A2872_01475 [Candidatus Gottesmanbacteria bacterium RIFCSPHIGHO2_01_FULL_42_12]|uniref:NAD(+) kinase n=1 Tax=Candidatus Gottesmanbacteria bacterium RIFCSPHIGHO2_01_FULL_42_12 TaxID=1798377 RepID=A0A1F5Z4Z7_9BACT|nr:MAG: hypothetical protein A2872_01475 [Candidatus Gottesmanbacteria bacterium RIFCSPHIGHO2_01_FULL_42_12]
MKVLLYGRYGRHADEVENLVKSFGIEVVRDNPEVVIAFGGDGTILGAERDWPDIPKLALKNSKNCHLCAPLPNEKMLELLSENKLTVKEYMKLEATVGDRKMTALNDVIIAHKHPNMAIRFAVDGGSEFVGDGLIFATPFGSTGYFYSVTKTMFDKGIGLAFNNIHILDIREQIYAEDAKIKILLTRGPAVLAVDNDPNLLSLPDSSEILVKKSPLTAKILVPI